MEQAAQITETDAIGPEQQPGNKTTKKQEREQIPLLFYETDSPVLYPVRSKI